MTTNRSEEALGRVAFIGISYNTDDYCQKLLRSLSKQEKSEQLDVLLVNNSASNLNDCSLDRLDSLPISVRIINAPDNPGYLGGARRALAQLSPNVYDWVIVANVDLEIDDTYFIEKLLGMQNMDNVAILSPSIASLHSGKESNPFLLNRPSYLRILFYRYCFASIGLSKIYHAASLLKVFIAKKLSLRKKKNLKKIEIYAGHGSFLVFSKCYFDKGGTLEFGAYMYGEEIYLAESCRKLGLQIVFEPKLVVKHFEKASTGVFYSKKILTWKAQSSKYLWETFFRS